MVAPYSSNQIRPSCEAALLHSMPSDSLRHKGRELHGEVGSIVFIKRAVYMTLRNGKYFKLCCLGAFNLFPAGGLLRPPVGF